MWGFEGVVCVGNEGAGVRGLELWWTVVRSGIGGVGSMGGPVEWQGFGALQNCRSSSCTFWPLEVIPNGWVGSDSDSVPMNR